MGGGTLDVSLLIISKIGTITVKAVGGDTHLGGEDLDHAMVNYCVQEFRKKENKDVSNNARAMMRLKVACEKAKRDLSSTTKTSIEIDSLYEGIDFSMQITRTTFEELNATFFIECIKYVENCLRDGNMHKKYIDDVVIVGGSTRVPKVQQILGDFFDGKAIYKSINADEAIAYGAAVWDANLCGYGNKKVKDLVILDVVPCSFGVNIYGQFNQVMIPRNTPIPAIKKRTYATVYHNQISLEIAVYQGNSSETKENTFLDSIILNHIPAAPAGKQNVSVCFNIDANGILNVSAELVSTGDKKSIQIEGLKGLRIEEKKIIRFEDSRDNWFKNLIQKLLKEGNNQVCNNKRFK